MFTDNYMGSALRHICAVLSIAAAVLATDIAFAQPIGSASPDIRTGVYRGRVVTYEIIDGLAVWDGDIILGTPEELSPANVPVPGKALDIRQKTLAAASSVAVDSKERLWPGGIIPYVIDPTLSNPNVLEAIQHWEQNTFIRFVERTDQPNRVHFVPSDGCRAHVGMIGGEQKVFLSEFCGVGAVIHEIGHAVGLWHEQQRNDRDLHVWVSSKPSVRHTYRTTFEQGGVGRLLDIGPYDYGSVMHYSFTGFTLNTIPPGIPHGSNEGLSAGDIDGVSRLYGRIPTRTTVTTNPPGLMIEVDGESYAAPHSFDWAPGTSYMIGVASPQKIPGAENFIGADYIRYLFAKWSDGGSQSHSVTASSETTVFIANFIEQIRPESSVNPPQGGTVRFDPPSADGFYTQHSFVKAIAEPAEGFSFEHWKPFWFTQLGGGFSTNPTLSIVSQHYPALFTRRSLTTIDTNVPGSLVLVDGSQTLLPANFAWEAGSTHTLDLLVLEGSAYNGVISPGGPGVGGRLIFNGWSDGGGSTHDITVSGEPTTITASFRRQVLLDAYSGLTGGGVVKIEPSSLEVSGLECKVVCSGPGRTYHDLSSSVRLTAQPALGFKFVTWIGDLSGTENPKSLLMDSYKRSAWTGPGKWVRAIFLDSHSFESDRLISGKPVKLLFGPGTARTHGYNGYWIDVSAEATQLGIRLVTATPGVDVDLYANREYYPRGMLDENNIVGYESQYLSTGPGGNESITITPESSPPLEPGPYFIAVNVRTAGGRVQGTLTAEVKVSESEISASVPVFGFPASLFTTSEGKTPPPQALEIRNSGGGTLDFQITADQSWLSVSPDQGSSAGETDTVEIAVDPANLELGAFEGGITITAPPAWPITVPVTLTVIPPPTPLIASRRGVILATATPIIPSISPNALISVFGEDFAPPETRALSPRVDSEGKVAVNLADTCLEINGERSPLFAVLPTQINAQAPTGVKPWQNNRVEVIRGCDTQEEQRSPAARVRGYPVSPAFFKFRNSPNSDGRYPVVALHGGGPGLAGAPGLLPEVELTPAAPGEIVTLFGTGFGLTDPPLEAGQIPATALPELNGAARLANRIRFRFDDITVPPEDVFYAGSAPCCAGLYQFTVRVPPGVPDGDLRVEASVWYSNVTAATTTAESFLTVRRR